MSSPDNELPELLQATIGELEKTQQALSDLKTENALLATKFSNLKYNSVDTVWRYFPAHCPEFTFLPPVDLDLRESLHRVGEYTLGQVIGEGQFSTVYKCKQSGGSSSAGPGEAAAGARSGATGMAMKVLHKDLMLTIDGALRTERELRALHVLGSESTHPNVLQFKHCMHGRRGVYIVTEEVPLDLVTSNIQHYLSFAVCLT